MEVGRLTPRYICLECGGLFEEPKRYTQRHGLDYPPYEETCGCPGCGGAFTDVILCSCCGEPITGDYVKIDDGDCYCDSCYTLRSLGDSFI